MSPASSKNRGTALVAAQVAALAAVAWPGRPRWRLPLPVTAVAALAGAAGTVLIEEGLRFLGPEITPYVEPRAAAHLRTTGPYAVSRHPVYTGLLAVAAATALLRRRPEPLAAAAVLAAVLHLKVGREEERLRVRFGVAYDEYAAVTPRLLRVPLPAVPGRR